MMHMKGTPKNMQNNPQYKNVTVEIINNLSQKIKKAESFNIRDIILDPGFGFGKTTNHNFKLLNDLSLFKKFRSTCTGRNFKKINDIQNTRY